MDVFKNAWSDPKWADYYSFLKTSAGELVNPQIWESIKQNAVFYVTALLCCVVIAFRSNSSVFWAVVSLVYVSFFGYVVHVFAHNVSFAEMLAKTENRFVKHPLVHKPLKDFCYLMDFHEAVHHDTSVSRETNNLLTEFALNFFTQGGALLAMILFFRSLNLYIVLLWALAYCTVHIINYDYLRPEAHARHHENKNVNYGIDLWDLTFATKAEGDPIEPINHYAINMGLITAALTVLL
jgi:hypothetical protein